MNSMFLKTGGSRTVSAYPRILTGTSHIRASENRSAAGTGLCDPGSVYRSPDMIEQGPWL